MTTPPDDRYEPAPGSPGSYIDTTTGEVVPGDLRAGESDYGLPHGSGQLARVSDDAIAALFDQRPLDVIGWAKALAQDAQFEDDGDNSPELDMVIAILTAQTSEEAFAVTNVKHAEDLVGDQPGGHGPLMTITGARPLKSTFTEGPACFCIIDATIKASGEAIKLTCGGRSVQALVLTHVNRGWLPFDAILTRRLKPTRNGFYPLNLEAGG